MADRAHAPDTTRLFSEAPGPGGANGKRVYRRAFALIDTRTRRMLYLTVPMAILASTLEALGLALVLPYVELLTDDAAVLSDLPEPVANIAEFFGAETVDGALQVLGALMVGLLLSKTLFTALATYLQLRIVARGETRLAVSMFERFMKAPYQFHVHTNSAETIRNVKASITGVIRKVLVSWTQLLTELTLVSVIAVALFALDPLLMIITSGFLLTVGVVYSVGLGRLSRRLGVVDMQLSRDSLMVMQESLMGLRAIRSLNREQTAMDEFRAVREEWEVVKRKTSFLGAAPRFYLEFCVVLGTAVMVVFLFATSDRSRALGLVALVIAATFRVLPSLSRILGAINQTKVGAASVDSLEEALEYLDRFHAVDAQAAQLAPQDSRDIQFEQVIHLSDVDFTYYGADTPALQGVELTVLPGQSVGLVGPSGAGKSTVVDLLLGLVFPTSGQVLIDGVPLVPANAKSWRSQIGYVPQDIYLSDASVRRNIAFGVPPDEIDEARVVAAAEAAQLADFIASLPDGLDAVVGEHGARLSGGQRQRVGIARALYCNPRVLLLDEATSALDSATEASVSEVIERLQGEMTVVVVAHRLSTVKKCDVIVHIDDGRVRAKGAFADLVDTDRKFAELVRLAEVR